jgi:hypothetical protein
MTEDLSPLLISVHKCVSKLHRHRFMFTIFKLLKNMSDNIETSLFRVWRMLRK